MDELRDKVAALIAKRRGHHRDSVGYVIAEAEADAILAIHEIAEALRLAGLTDVIWERGFDAGWDANRRSRQAHLATHENKREA